MRNWLCLTHFPDGTERIRLVPGPAPVPPSATDDRPIVIKIDREDRLWLVKDISLRVTRLNDAAEIWVEPATDGEVRDSACGGGFR